MRWLATKVVCGWRIETGQCRVDIDDALRVRAPANGTRWPLVVVAVWTVVVAAFQSPGQMSVDSVAALYEGATKTAAGWGPTFFSAFLEWLGGGLVGTSLFVAIVCCVTYGCLGVLLTERADGHRSPWKIGVAWLLAANPVFAFYVGIVWKDVMLATVAMAAGTCMLLAVRRSGTQKYLLLVAASVLTASMVLIRQQGILLAAPFAVVLSGMAARRWRARKAKWTAVLLIWMLAIAGTSTSLDRLSNSTIRPQAASPISVGFLTIRAYDIAGMIRYSRAGDADDWAEAPAAAKAAIREEYSPERIDTIWHVPAVRSYFNGLSAEQYSSIWRSGIRHDPWAYLQHRVQAFSYLLGLRDINGCVPAYWGVAGVSEQMQALGLQEQMDARARVIGRTAQRLYETPIFRNWFYVALLLLATGAALFRTRGECRWACGVIALGAWLYLGSFVPTTIACDVRYLYPVATLATLLAIFLLTQDAIVGESTNGKSSDEGHAVLAAGDSSK